MAVAAYDTQQGATVTLGTDSLTLRIVSIGPLVEKVVNIPTKNLASTTKQTWAVGELADYDEIEVVYQNSPALANPTKVHQTITITGPTATGAGTPESVTGTGYINTVTVLPGFSSENEGLQMKRFVIKFDGLTGPTRTVSS
jgi:hypothetical protein